MEVLIPKNIHTLAGECRVFIFNLFELERHLIVAESSGICKFVQLLWEIDRKAQTSHPSL